MAGDEVFKVRKFCSLIVTEWAGFSANVRSGESTIQRLEGIRDSCLVSHDLGPYPITWARVFYWQLRLLGLCSDAWLLPWGMLSSQPPGSASWMHIGLHFPSGSDQSCHGNQACFPVIDILGGVWGIVGQQQLEMCSYRSNSQLIDPQSRP